MPAVVLDNEDAHHKAGGDERKCQRRPPAERQTGVHQRIEDAQRQKGARKLAHTGHQARGPEARGRLANRRPLGSAADAVVSIRDGQQLAFARVPVTAAFNGRTQGTAKKSQGFRATTVRRRRMQELLIAIRQSSRSRLCGVYAACPTQRKIAQTFLNARQSRVESLLTLMNRRVQRAPYGKAVLNHFAPSVRPDSPCEKAAGAL
jgi:hypothetical protein